MKKIFSTPGRWLRRTFLGRDKELRTIFEEERLESPSRTVVKRFFSSKLNCGACLMLALFFLLVLLGPLITPLDLSYNESSQANIKPGMGLLSVPKGLQGNVRDLSASSTYTVAVDNNGQVYVWGIKTRMSRSTDLKDIPQEVRDADIVKVAAGTDHIIAVAANGKVYGWGERNNAQYGDNPDPGKYSLYRYWPAEVSAGFASGDEVAQIIAGQQVSALIKTDGSLYIWGNTQLSCINRVEVMASSGQAAKAAFAQSNIVILRKDGTVDFGGVNSLARVRVSSSGEIIEENDSTPPPLEEESLLENEGSGEPEVTEPEVTEPPAATPPPGTRMADISEEILQGRRVVDIASTSSTCALLLEDGEIIISGNASNGEKDIPEESLDGNIKAIVGGRYHYYVLTEQGRLIGWGGSFFGQADPPSMTNVAMVYTGHFHNYAENENGSLRGWGLKGYLLGTDGFGRDILNRIINGGRMTMTIGAIAVIISTIIGLLIGCISGYFGGWIDMLLMRVAEIISSLPFLPFALILSAVVRTLMTEDQRIMMIMVVLGVLSWPPLARLSRAQVLAEREKEFVVAAKAIGVRESKIAFKHILPNIISVILVTMTLDFAGCMLTESSLSYLGFGVSPPQPTWGNMLTGANNSVIIQQYWWQWVFPAVALAICTISINLIGDGLRDAIDPKSGER